MTALLKKYPFFLLLLPLFILVHIEKDFPGLIEYRLVSDLVIIMFLAPAIFFVLFYLISRSVKKASLQAFVALLFFYFFGEIKNTAGRWWPDSPWQGYSLLVPVLGMPVLYILYRIAKSKSAFLHLFSLLNIFLFAFIAVDIIILFNNKRNDKQAAPDLVKNYQPCDTCTRPDIYYIIFDSYTSFPVLKEDFNYPNTDLENSLQQKRFWIIPGSMSNYNLTAFSIPSILNMDYLQDADTSKTYYTRDFLHAAGKAYYNPLFPLLEKENYRIFNHSIFNTRSHPATTPVFDIWDIRSLFRQYNFFFKAFNEMSYHLPYSIRYFFSDEITSVYARQRDRLDSAIIRNVIETSALSTEQPKFVYAHISKPHFPYTFDSLGRPVDPFFITEHEEWKEPYLQQLVYSNKIIKQLTDTIISNARRPLVIILQGDHGYRYFNKKDNRKEFSILNAVYFSNGNYHLLTDSISSVNTFRVVFNTFFQKEYPLLENKFFFFKIR